MGNKVLQQETRKIVKGVEYIISSVFNPQAKETGEIKLLRLLENQVSEEIKSAENAAFISQN